ncbi:hypothetical protein AB0G86_05975 [Streptomyces scabiei]
MNRSAGKEKLLPSMDDGVELRPPLGSRSLADRRRSSTASRVS